MNSLDNLLKLKLFLVILIFMNSPMHADPLKDYLWTNRVAVVDSMPMRKKEMHSSKCLSKNNKEH